MVKDPVDATLARYSRWAGKLPGSAEAVRHHAGGPASFPRHCLGQSAIGLAPVADADDQDDELFFGDLINDPIVANT